MKAIQIEARKRQDSNGNTYHSVKVTLHYGFHNSSSYIHNYEYGYGSQYLVTAYELIKNTTMGIEVNLSNYRDIYHYCQENDIIYIENCETVTRKKELNF